MKTLKLVAVCALSAACSLSYGQKTQALSSRILEGWEESYFHYNNDNLLDSLHTYVTGNDSWETYRTFEYDDKGMNTRENGYQYLDGGFKHVFYVDYTYTEDGQIKTRLNYNSNGQQECSLSAKMEWEYKDGRLDKVSTYFPSWTVPGEFDLFTEERCVYKGDVLQAKEMWLISFGSSELMKVSSIEYTYNKLGKVEVELAKNFDSATGAVTSSTRDVYKYDQNGNLIEFANYLQNGTDPMLKYIYHYDMNLKSENVVLPYNFEDAPAPHYVAMLNSTNAIVKEEWWQVPNETDELVHGGDFIWTYKQNTTSIQHAVQQNSGVNFYINNESLYFQGLRDGQTVQLYDVNGALVKQTAYSNTGISLNTLPKGVYVVRTGKQAFRFVK